MATVRTTWDPRSEMAKDAVEAMEMAIEDWPARTLSRMLQPQEAERGGALLLDRSEPRIAVLSCQHWIHSFAELDTAPGINLFCQYCVGWRRLLKVVQL